MTDDPCFRCVLPDCDETSPRCLVKRLALQYDHKRRCGRLEEVTPAEREASTAKFTTWHLERMAQASEGVRPYKRKGSPWTGGVRAGR